MICSTGKRRINEIWLSNSGFPVLLDETGVHQSGKNTMQRTLGTPRHLRQRCDRHRPGGLCQLFHDFEGSRHRTDQEITAQSFPPLFRCPQMILGHFKHPGLTVLRCVYGTSLQ